MRFRSTLGPGGTVMFAQGKPVITRRTLMFAQRTLTATVMASELSPGAPGFDPSKLPGVGQEVGGRYRLADLLGEGQFGRVYRAVRTDMNEHCVALKVLSTEMYAGRDPERELRLLSAVGHPHIVQLADHGVEADYIWFTMPFYKGRTLDAQLASRPLVLREAFEIFSPIAEGLEVLHASGLRHQDIKPENVFLATFNNTRFPLVLDLGAAAPARAALPVAGTLLFAAPEQARAILACLDGHPAPADLSERVDTYGLAATLLRSLVGPELFPGGDADDSDDVGEVRRRLEEAFVERERAPLRPGALPGLTGQAREQLSVHLQRWLSPDPSRRPSMGELRDELSVLLAGEKQERRARQTRRAAAAIVGASALLAAAAWGWKSRHDHALGMCNSTLAGAQRQAISSITSLDHCKGLLTQESSASHACQLDLDAERTLRLSRGTARGGCSPAEHQFYTSRLDRCDAAGKVAVGECEEARDDQKKRADDLAREVTQVRLERDELARDLEAARRAGAPGAATASPGQRPPARPAQPGAPPPEPQGTDASPTPASPAPAPAPQPPPTAQASATIHIGPPAAAPAAPAQPPEPPRPPEPSPPEPQRPPQQASPRPVELPRPAPPPAASAPAQVSLPTASGPAGM
jgi:eukaryotic-like serine/threonine-protein kinase